MVRKIGDVKWHRKNEQIILSVLKFKLLDE